MTQSCLRPASAITSLRRSCSVIFFGRNEDSGFAPALAQLIEADGQEENRAARDILKALDFEHLFVEVLGPNDVERPKPDEARHALPSGFGPGGPQPDLHRRGPSAPKPVLELKW